MKKFALIFPPIWSFSEPNLACPSLVAQLKEKGYCANVIDLNIDFFNEVLTSKKVKDALFSAQKIYEDLKLKKDEILNGDLSYENSIQKSKYQILHSFFSKDISVVDNVIQNVDKAVKIIKNPDEFYKYNNATWALKTIKYATFIISLPFSPFFLERYSSSYKLSSLNYENIKEVLFDTSQNMFFDFYQQKILEIKEKNYSFVGISISNEAQLIPALTLCYMLKKETSAHISIGGSFFTRVYQNLQKFPEFFELFADSVAYGEGELSILEQAKYIDGQIPIENVSGIVYKEGNEVKINSMGESPILSKIAIPDYSDYDFSKYFSPEPVIPLQTQRGCYWRKCAFCDLFFAKTYTVKKIDDLIAEIRLYKEKYGVKHFYVIDEAMVPEYLENFCDALISADLNINFMISLRLEKKLNINLLKKAYKAGLRYVEWGVETGNKRIYNLINKGSEFNGRNKILKDADRAGIYNYVFAFYSFPTETYNEALDTLKFVSKNAEYIHELGFGHFNLSRHSIVSSNPEKYGIIIDEEQMDFSHSLKFREIKSLTEEEVRKFEKEKEKVFSRCYYNSTIFFDMYNYTNVFLYCSKYDLKTIKDLRINHTKY